MNTEVSSMEQIYFYCSSFTYLTNNELSRKTLTKATDTSMLLL